MTVRQRHPEAVNQMRCIVQPSTMQLLHAYNLIAEAADVTLDDRSAPNTCYPVPDRSGNGVLFSIDFFFVSLFLC